MEDRELSQTEIVTKFIQALDLQHHQDQLVAYQLKKLDKEYHATVNAKILTVIPYNPQIFTSDQVEESKTATQEKHTCTKLRANSIQEEDIKPNNQWEQFEEKDDDDEAGYETLSDDDGKEKDDEKEEVVAVRIVNLHLN